LHIAKGKINDTQLYRCLDRLLPLKTKVEHIYDRVGQCFAQSLHLFTLCAALGIGKSFRFSMAKSADFLRVSKKETKGCVCFPLGMLKRGFENAKISVD
jgi:hypothetical protein